MSLFAKGNFNIKESWGEGAGEEKKTPQVKPPLVNQSRDNQISPLMEKQTSLSSILNQAGQQSVQQRDLLDDQISRRIVANLRNEGGIAENLPNYARRESPRGNRNPLLIAPDVYGSNQKKPPISNPNSSSDVLSTLAARLSKVEQLCNNQREEIKEKTIKISALQDQLDLYKQSSSEKDRVQQMKVIKNENEAFQQRIVELENFLSYYGMKWVGEDPANRKSEGKLDIDRMKKDLDPSQKPKFNYSLPQEIDFNVILRRIEELNFIVEKQGAQEVVQENGMHKIKKMENFPIGFYCNGIALKGFPFFPYTSNEAMQILSDILDGYFPYQLKKKFPDGTLLSPIDRIEVPYDPEQIGEINDIHSLEERALKPVSKEEFLEKLPQNVIRNGQVIPIREEVRKKMEGGGSNLLLDEDKMKYPFRENVDGALIPLTQEQQLIDKNELSPSQLEEITTLKIRTQSGKSTIFLQLWTNKTIKDVYDICSNFSESQDFVFFSNVTRIPILKDAKGNLQQLELAPSSVLNMKQI